MGSSDCVDQVLDEVPVKAPAPLDTIECLVGLCSMDTIPMSEIETRIADSLFAAADSLESSETKT